MYIVAFSLKNSKTFSARTLERLGKLYTDLRKGPLDEVLIIKHESLMDIFAVCLKTENIEQYIIDSVQQGLDIRNIKIEKKYLRNEAISYFFQLISGKYEKLIGESSMLIKIKEAFNVAMDFNATGPILTRLYRQGTEYSQDINQHPELKKYCVTRTHAVIDISRKISENINNFQVLFIAQDKEPVEPLMLAFKNNAVGKFFIFSTNFTKSYEISSELSCTPLESDQLQQYLAHDTIIINMDSDSNQIWRYLHAPIRSNKDKLYIFFQYVAAKKFNGNTKLPNLFIQTLDQIDSLIDLHLKKRREFFETLHKAIDREIQLFYEWLYSDQRYIFSGIVSRDRSMQKTFELIRRIAPSGINVLINGATGSGKELVARAIHQNSTRNSGNFVAVNCSAIPETLLEGELFGYEKGAFTGAIHMKKGLVELASGGTLFLDEIGDIPHTIQIKLLRVLQEREIMRIGNPNPIRVDVRLIAATNHNLKTLIEQGKFRLDLFYRLNTAQINLPSLLERSSDILLLARYFIEKFNKQHDKNVHSYTEEVKHCLQNYNWPGNVRELENLIERAVAVSVGDTITLSDLPSQFRKYSKYQPHRPSHETLNVSSLKEREAAYIQELLQQENMNYSRVAELLGIGRTTLWRKMKEYEIVAQKKS
jgi:DNA-binding NtrC family response regulator